MKADRTIAVIGLGYVGLPVAVAFGTSAHTIGFDISRTRIAELQRNYDRTGEVTADELLAATVHYTSNVLDLTQADFYIIAVPTPVNDANQPDLSLLISASTIVGQALQRGAIVVYESTVYPGATEEECLPVLEKFSGLTCGVDFKIGYSPERINPGDKLHSFTSIKKVVAGWDAESLDEIARTYELVVTAGVYRAPAIMVAEAAKVIENTQRDLNIALMNELAVVFDRMGIDTLEVLEAAGSKWNFLPFKPGLVGGHCIGVDPYYLTHKAEKIGYIPQVILAGRRINDGMGAFIAHRTVKEMIHAGHIISGSTVTILGLTFKEDCPDLRNSKVVDIINELAEYGINIQIHDPLANADEARHEYGITLLSKDNLKPAAAIVSAVAHKIYRDWTAQDLKLLLSANPVLIDVKGIFNVAAIKEAGIRLWRL